MIPPENGEKILQSQEDSPEFQAVYMPREELFLPLSARRSAFEDRAPACHWCVRRDHMAISGDPRRSGGDFSQTEECSRTELCREPTAIPPVDAPIREGSAIEEAECRVREDILEMGCREGLEAAAPSTVKESPWRPCSRWWREKCWTDGWPARVPYTAGEKQLCLLTCGPLAANGRAVKGLVGKRPATGSPNRSGGRARPVCSLFISSSSTSEPQVVDSREAAISRGAAEVLDAQWGKMEDSLSQSSSRERRVMRRKSSQILHFEVL